MWGRVGAEAKDDGEEEEEDESPDSERLGLKGSYPSLFLTLKDGACFQYPDETYSPMRSSHMS